MMTDRFHAPARTIVCAVLTAAILTGNALPAASAQTSSSSPSATGAAACNAAFQDRLTQQQRVFRQTLFGRQRAETMPVNSVRHTEDGTLYLKTGDNAWVTTAPGRPQRISDDRMNRTTEWEGMNDPGPAGNRSERLGIFAQKKKLTSELIPELAQSLRAFICRTEMVCQAMTESPVQADEGTGLLTIVTPGCAELLTPPVDACAFTEGDTRNPDRVAGFSLTVTTNECGPMARQLVEREEAFLKIAVAYDAAQRSVLQLGGGIDTFLRGLKGDFLAPLQQTLPLISLFSRIPCFTAQCNE